MAAPLRERTTDVQVSPGAFARVRIGDLNWKQDGESTIAEVRSEDAGLVLLEARPLMGDASLYAATAYCFLGVEIWQKLNLATLEVAQLNLAAWWKKVGGPQAKSVCRMDGCSGEVFSGDLCSKHYDQLRRQAKRSKVSLASLLELPRS